MATTTFDKNQWYQLYTNEDKKSSLIGTSLFNRGGTTGAVFFNTTDTSTNVQRWQIFPVTVNGSIAYTIRSKDGGPNGFMGTGFNANGDTATSTRPMMLRGDIANNTVYWTFNSWGDGTWFMTNAANDDQHLNRQSNGLLSMSSNITAPQNGQRWGFASIAKIDDEKYSSVNLAGVSSTSASGAVMSMTLSSATSGSTIASSTVTSFTASASPDANTPPSPGLSTGVKAAIGATIGGVLLIVLIVLGLCCLKRRKQSQQYAQPSELPHDPLPLNYELYHDGAAKHEMPSTSIAEVPRNERPAELPAYTVGSARWHL